MPWQLRAGPLLFFWGPLAAHLSPTPPHRCVRGREPLGRAGSGPVPLAAAGTGLHGEEALRGGPD